MFFASLADNNTRIIHAHCHDRSAFVFAGIDIGEVRVKKALENTGFDASRPTVWVLEGLVMCAPPGSQ